MTCGGGPHGSDNRRLGVQRGRSNAKALMASWPLKQGRSVRAESPYRGATVVEGEFKFTWP